MSGRALILLLAAAVLIGVGYRVYASFRRAHGQVHIVEASIGGANSQF